MVIVGLFEESAVEELHVNGEFTKDFPVDIFTEPSKIGGFSR